MHPLVEFKAVTKVFANKAVLQTLNLSIHQGEFFVLVGPSGSGKTTTLKMINALQIPTEGNIFFKGKRIKDYDVRKLRWQIGYVLQQIALFPNMTVAENIELIPDLLGWSRSKRQKRVEELLVQVGLNPAQYAHRLPHELSGGEQQRVGILRAIAAQPDVILMDEPFSALDPISRQQLQDLMLDLHAKLNNTIIFVTHDMKEALKMGDRIALMQEGRLIQCDRPENIAQNPHNDFVRQFFSGQTSSLNTQDSILDCIHSNLIYPLNTENTKNSSFIEANATLGDLFALLATEERVTIMHQQQALGSLDRAELLSILSRWV